MDSPFLTGFVDELTKLGVVKIKSNDPMALSSRANVQAFMDDLHEWDSPHKEKAIAFAGQLSEKKLFELLHSMRRWYTGQTMAWKILAQNDALGEVMRLKPKDVVGVYRGFKVPNDSPLAKVSVGDTLHLPVTRNRGISSWSTSEAPTNRFSGGGKGKTGLIVKLIDDEGITPILAPPEKTKAWFNALYERTIGTSFRPKEGEYLIAAPKVRVEVVRVKR